MNKDVWMMISLLGYIGTSILFQLYITYKILVD